MARFCFFSFLFLLIITTSQSQSLITIYDDFSSNKLNWANSKTSIIKNDHYEIDGPGDRWMVYLNSNIKILNDQTDFALEATFTQVDGKIDNGLGLFWGYDDEKKLNNFVFSSDGYFKVYSSDESRLDAKEWKQAKSIKALGQENKLRIENSGGKTIFFINGTEVARMKSLPLFGKFMGFVCYTKLKYQVDDFSFSQKVTINLPAHLRKGLIKENMGAMINTIYHEVSPVISTDGKTLFFGRKNHPENIGKENDYQDIWFSSSKNGIDWQASMNMGIPVNSLLADNMVSISQDNNTLLKSTENGFKVFAYSGTEWTDNGALGLTIENENEYFNACQSADGKAILFVAENNQNLYYKKNADEKDIYVSLKDTKGQWSLPINLGSDINTTGDEMTPFLSADGRTLYFASNGWPGYGNVDIFMSKRIGNEWTNWTEPVNLGPEINTFSFDAYYTVPASGDYAYMVSNSPGHGKADIIRIKLSQEIKPDPVVLIYGKTLNAKTNQPIEADIFFENLTTAKEAGEAISNPKTGEYRIALPFGTSYGFRAAANGFLSVNENLELTLSDKNYKEIEKDLYLVPIEIGQAIQLQNVFFVQGKAELKSESYPELDRLAAILNDNPTIEIELSGHTDNRGDISANYDLSDNRVKAVLNYLATKGIGKNRMRGKGYGGTKPMVPNDTEEHRQMNRRVEFKIVKK